MTFMDLVARFLGEFWWHQWWFWGMLAAFCGILELILPGYIFLGFAIGASAMAAIYLAGPGVSGFLPEGLPALLVVFAVLSILSWVVLRLLFRLPGGQVKTFRHDINED